MSTQKATSVFIDKAKAKHGDKCDYSQVVYLTAKKLVKIVCLEHGAFMQTPDNHLSGKGCPRCALETRKLSQRLSKDAFISRATTLLGDRYDYSQAQYEGLRSKVTIICPEHGSFAMTPGTHLKGRHCPKCTGRALVTTDEFISRAKTIHGDRYDYSLVKCEHNRQAVKIICREHGIFEQAPRNHLMGRGCEQCASLKRGLKKRTTAADQFLEKARNLHGDRYDYSLTQYKRNNANITIGCPEHGYFQQIPRNHLIGRGCPSCSSTGFDPTLPAILYYLSINNGQAYKIGITNRTIEERFSIEDRLKIAVVGKWHFEIGQDAREREIEILRKHYINRYTGPDLLRNGNSELFKNDVLGLKDSTDIQDPDWKSQLDLW
jgi:hypothetical protein